MTTLATYSAAARALTGDSPLAGRIEGCLAALAAALPRLQLRVTVWPANGSPGGEPLRWQSPGAGGPEWVQHRVHQIALQRQPLALDSGGAPALPQDSQPAPNVSYLGLPVTWEGRLWGVLEARRPGAFEAGERTLLTGLLPLLAAAIGGGQQTALAPPPAGDERQSLLAALARELEAPSDLHPLLTNLLRWAMDYTRAAAGAINLVNPERGEYTTMVFEGYPAVLEAAQLHGTRQTWSWDVGIVGRVARTGKPALLTDSAGDPLGADVRAELVAPVRIDGATLAVIVLDSVSAPGFDAADLAFIQALAAAAARPLQRALVAQEMLEARAQLQQTLASLPLGLALIDLEGRVLRTNEAWFRLWQVPPPADEASQYLPWDLLPTLLKRLSHPLELTDFFADAQNRPAATLELTLRLLEPAQDLHLRSLPARDALGMHTGRLIIIEDVTREREIDKMKNEFVSVVSHELRTPLTSILGYTELLLARDFSRAERQEFIQTVYDQANQLSQMVDDLLNLSRLDAGQIKLSRWVVSLHQIIREITKQLNETLSERHRLLIDIPEGIPPIYADKDKIRQILTNLLSNAIKYSPGGGQIGLIVRELPGPRSRVLPPGAPPLPPERALLLAIRDQGMGIAAEDLPNVFQRFFRVDNSMTRKIGGTGLGLSITRALVELHGGAIWATSEPGKGTTFWLTLPIATELARRG